MSNPDTCPNCGNIYGNEPRKLPCDDIVCHKCCLILYNKEDNSLDCPKCSRKHVFKSKNTFKKALQQVAHSGFGKKTSTREISFASTMPVEKATAVEKSANKEVKKAAANLPTVPPNVPSETSSISKQSKLVDAVAKLPTSVIVESYDQSKIAQQQTTSNILSPPSLFSKIVSPPVSSSDIVTARCHRCGIKCEVFVCDHCELFVCLKCADEHRTTTTTNIDSRDLTINWQECKNKYDILRQKLDKYNNLRTQIENDCAAIRVALEQRTQDAIQNIYHERESLINHINKYAVKEQTMNNIKHIDLVNDYHRIEDRLKSALNGEDIGSYTQDDFLNEIHELHNRLNQRRNLIETHSLQIPTINRYEQISIKKILGELYLDCSTKNGVVESTISSLNNPSFSDRHILPRISPAGTITKPTALLDIPTRISPSTIISNLSSIDSVTLTNNTTNAKPLMEDIFSEGTTDMYDQFRRMAAQIHQQFSTPFSKVTNIPSTSTVPSAFDGVQKIDGNDKNTKISSVNMQNKILPKNNTFVQLWKIEHTAVPNFLCMTPYPTPKLFVLDKYGKVSICQILSKAPKTFESHSLFSNGFDELIESAAVSSHFLIVYSRKRQDTMSGTIYFFTHECKSVLSNGIHQTIPVHHILCDQNANRLYCLDRMRCIIYYYTLPNRSTEIETCLKTRHDFIHFNSSYAAFKMMQNDNIIGFYERNTGTVHLYDKKTTHKTGEFKCEHATDRFESWGIIAIRKDNNNLIFKIDERDDHDTVNRQHIVYEVNRLTKQILATIQLNSVFGMIIGPYDEVILGIRQNKDTGIIQSYKRL